MAKQAHFEIVSDDGHFYLDRAREFPKRLTRKQALALAVEKWQMIVDYYKDARTTLDDGGAYTCALCEKYEFVYCSGCPGNDKRGCCGTYWEYHEHQRTGDVPNARDAARKVLRYLQRKAKETT